MCYYCCRYNNFYESSVISEILMSEEEKIKKANMSKTNRLKLFVPNHDAFYRFTIVTKMKNGVKLHVELRKS